MTIESMAAAREVEACRATWEERHKDYQLARMLYDANAEFGLMAAAYREHEDERHRLVAAYGTFERAKATPEGAFRADRAWQRITAAEARNDELCLDPLWKAARALVLTPAPDLPALKLKMEVIKLEEVWNDANLEGDCWEIIQADVARLRGAA